ncbi:chorismate mutase [Acetobacterium sp.]|uniref:chorismate mutase n=1 Tax=Acetobacterium sp. TaxID=1872094 RepID=UPI002F4232E2
MKSLDTIRKTIDEIDGEIRVLFERRMDCIKAVAEYKYNNNEKIFDPSREEVLIKKNLEELNNKEYRAVYKEFLQTLMNSSKEYQKRWIKFQQDRENGQ